MCTQVYDDIVSNTTAEQVIKVFESKPFFLFLIDNRIRFRSFIALRCIIYYFWIG